MLEQMTKRIETKARRRAQRRALELAERMHGAAPKGVTVDAIGGGVRLTGRGLLRRFLLDPALRWLALRSL